MMNIHIEYTNHWVMLINAYYITTYDDNTKVVVCNAVMITTIIVTALFGYI